MTLFYSQTANGFFDDAIHTTLPQDAVEISAATHQALLKANGRGARLVADKKGYPQAVFPGAAAQLATAKAVAHRHRNIATPAHCRHVG